jgi:hypothetical protein
VADICLVLVMLRVSMSVRASPDGQSILYADTGIDGTTTFYRQAWHLGKLTGEPIVEVTFPFGLPAFAMGATYDFARNLSTIVYARPWEQADFYFFGVQWVPVAKDSTFREIYGNVPH